MKFYKVLLLSVLSIDTCQIMNNICPSFKQSSSIFVHAQYGRGGRGRGRGGQQQQEKQEDYYELLGVPRDANEQQIKKKFKKMAIKYHPDKNKDDPETAKVKF